jgi:hypothetical protein
LSDEWMFDFLTMVPQETSGALFRYAKPLMIHSRKADIIEPLERINMLVESSSKRLIISFAFLAGMTFAVQGNGRTERQSTEERQALLWSRLKTALTQANGKEYFQLSVKNVVIPGGADDLEYLRGTVVSIDANRVSLALSEHTVTEVTLIVNPHLSEAAKNIRAGQTVEFSGVADDFKTDTFIVFFREGRVRPIK